MGLRGTFQGPDSIPIPISGPSPPSPPLAQPPAPLFGFLLPPTQQPTPHFGSLLPHAQTPHRVCRQLFVTSHPSGEEVICGLDLSVYAPHFSPLLATELQELHRGRVVVHL